MNIRKADKVYINTGKDKGKTGNVLAVYPKDDAVLIEKINIIKKHLKPTKALQFLFRVCRELLSRKKDKQ